MDFMRIIKSLEEFLYELMVWLVFYPVTLWRAVVHPQRMMTYADDEIDDPDSDRYSDTLSPPIFLALSLLIAHAIEKTAPHANQLGGILADDEKLIAYRIFAFSLFPLLASIRMMRHKGMALDRNTLRQPFYAQCFIAAPFALGVDLSSALAPYFHGHEAPTIFGLLGLTCLWYLSVQTLWFSTQLSISKARGFGDAILSFAQATLCVAVVSALVEQL